MIIPTSIPQNRLLHAIREKYPEAVLNYPVKIPDKGYKRYPDVAIVRLRLCLEYDGIRHHLSKKSRERDAIRDEELRRAGWVTIRVNKNNWKRIIANLDRIVQARERELASQTLNSQSGQ